MRVTVRQLRCRRVLVPACVLAIVLFGIVLINQNLGYIDEFADSGNQVAQDKAPFVGKRPQFQAPDNRPAGQIAPPKQPPAEYLETPQKEERERDGHSKPKPAPERQVPGPVLQPPSNIDNHMTQEEIQGGAPKNTTLLAIRNQIREMTAHAFNSYMKYAKGHNELRPVSKVGHKPYVLGTAPMGATIVDALDTLYIMNLRDEFEAGRKFVAEELNFNQNSLVSVFEFTIRYLGGLLTAYTFTSDKVFLDQAVNLTKRLLPAFDTPTKLPISLLNLQTGKGRMFSWSPNGCALLAEVGTLHMEFRYLSELTGDPVYAQRVHCIRDILDDLKKPNDVFYNHIDHKNRKWCSSIAGLSGASDSYYEYLLKEWIRTGHQDTQAHRMYHDGIESLYSRGLFKTSPKGHLYLGTLTGRTVSNTMDHLACFAGGMLALGASGPEDEWFKRGVEITRTCNHSYASTVTQLGPEAFTFDAGAEAVPLKQNDKTFLLRPETVESYFYLWRFTKDEAYRTAALKVVQALEKYTRTSNGYSGLRNVNNPDAGFDDVQQSFFLAETLKYLYLIFSEDSLLPLDRWVYNSEAHPFPIHHAVSLDPSIQWPKPFEPPKSCKQPAL